LPQFWEKKGRGKHRGGASPANKRKRKEKDETWVSKIAHAPLTHLVTMKDGYPEQKKRGKGETIKEKGGERGKRQLNESGYAPCIPLYLLVVSFMDGRRKEKEKRRGSRGEES